jgi:hypothetical protein
LCISAYRFQSEQQSPFCNPAAIEALHHGMETILTYYHYLNKGTKPFELALTDEGLQEVRDRTGLTHDQAELIRDTANMVKERGECPTPSALPLLAAFRSR